MTIYNSIWSMLSNGKAYFLFVINPITRTNKNVQKGNEIDQVLRTCPIPVRTEAGCMLRMCLGLMINVK